MLAFGFVAPMWRCGLASAVLCLALVFAVLRVLDAIEAFRSCWLSGLPSECVGSDRVVFGIDLARVAISSVHKWF